MLLKLGEKQLEPYTLEQGFILLYKPRNYSGRLDS
jgi:hypothetical protein